MSIKRYAGSGFTEVSTRKRWNGSAWVALTVGKRWNGAAWVDLWSASGGSGSSGSASGSGWLVKNALSSASSPHVHYSAQYAAQRDGGAVAVTLTFAAWLNSSASRLGSGIGFRHQADGLCAGQRRRMVVGRHQGIIRRLVGRFLAFGFADSLGERCRERRHG